MLHFILKTNMKKYLIIALLLSGCLSTDTGNLTTDRRHAVENVLLAKGAKVLGTVAMTTLASAAVQEIGGGQVDWQHDLASAAWANSGNIVTSQDFTNITTAATMNHVPNTVAVAAQQLEIAQSRGTPTKDAVNAIANTVSGIALASNTNSSSK